MLQNKFYFVSSIDLKEMKESKLHKKFKRRFDGIEEARVTSHVFGQLQDCVTACKNYLSFCSKSFKPNEYSVVWDTNPKFESIFPATFKDTNKHKKKWDDNEIVRFFVVKSEDIARLQAASSLDNNTTAINTRRKLLSPLLTTIFMDKVLESHNFSPTLVSRSIN